MRIQQELDSFLILLDNIIHEAENTTGQPQANPSTVLIALYKQCRGIRDQVQILRNAPILKWDPTVRYLYTLFTPILTHVQGEDHKGDNYSFTMQALAFKIQNWATKVFKDLEAISEIGKELEPLTPEQVGNITFKSIVGAELEKTKLTEGFILPFTYATLYPKRASGVLLYGLPGVGKSLLAKAAVKQFGDDAYFFAPATDSFRGKYEGQTEAKITALFDNVQYYLNQPGATKKYAIIFIDEGEALLGPDRDTGDVSKQRSVPTFLQCMDGIQSDSRIVVFVATNYPALDGAVLRRLSLRIHVQLPNEQAIKTLVLRVLVDRFVHSTPAKFEDPDKEQKEKLQLFSNFRTFGSSDVLTEAQINKEVIELLQTTKDKPGYSPSDIIKGLDLACNIASRRILARVQNKEDGQVKLMRPRLQDPRTSIIAGEYYREQLFLRAVPDNPKLVLLNGSYDSTIADVYIYNTNPEKDKEMGWGLLFKDDDSLSPLIKNRIISFDLRWIDIKEAFSATNFRNSSSQEDYQKLIDWERSVDV